MKTPMVVVLLLSFLLVNCESGWNPLDRTESPGIIAGFVKCQSRNPLSGIRVVLNETGASAYTNSNGIFSFRDVPVGVYSLVFFDAASSISIAVDGIAAVS